MRVCAGMRARAFVCASVLACVRACVRVRRARAYARACAWGVHRLNVGEELDANALQGGT